MDIRAADQVKGHTAVLRVRVGQVQVIPFVVSDHGGALHIDFGDIGPHIHAAADGDAVVRNLTIGDGGSVLVDVEMEGSGYRFTRTVTVTVVAFG